MKPNQTILITRPEPFAGQLAQTIRQAGGNPLLFPVIQVADPFDEDSLQTLLTQLAICDWAIFISPTSVLQTFARLSAQTWPASVKIAAIGKGTAQQLSAEGLKVSFIPPEYNSEALLAASEFAHINGKKIILFRGEGGRELLATTLQARGAQVFHAVVYRRVLPAAPEPARVAAWKEKGIDVIVITSQEALSNLLTLVGKENEPWLKQQRVLVTSAPIKAAALQAGFISPLCAKNASDQAIVDALNEGE